jgi:glycosyltransferase involved in cell wall biosynthesis
MKVAYFTNQYPSVSHTFIRREIAALEEIGIEVERFSIRPPPEQLVDPDDVAEQGRTTVLLALGVPRLVWTATWTAILHPIRFLKALRMSVRMGLRSDRGLLRNLGYLMEACTALHLFRRAQCTHVHAHFGTNSTTVALLCRILGGPPYSFTVHGPEEFDKPRPISLTKKIEGASFVAGVSSFGRSQLYRQCGHDQWPKVKVVRCGVDRAYIDARITPIGDTRRLVCVGRICEQKGQLLLIQAAAKVRDMGERFELVLVGDGEMRSKVESLVQQYDLGDVVTITGWASGEEVRRQIIGARALVLPSFAEGLPVVIMEALALGRPVLSTYIAGIPELVEPDACGWLVPAGSVDALVQAMLEVLRTSPERLEELGREGRRRVLVSHDARAAIGPLVEGFRSSAAAQRP